MNQPRPTPLLTETDLALVSALQVAPRAPWSAIGRAVGVDPVTAARRWARLEEERLAWFIVRPSAEQLAPDADAAMLKMTCKAGTQVQVAERIAAVREAYAVDMLSGDGDVVVLLIGRGLAGMRRLIESLVDDPNVTSHNGYFVSQVHREDAQWRLGVLTPEQRQELLQSKPGRAVPPPPDVVAEIAQVLREDPRMSLADLGRRMNLSEPTARRLLDRVLRSRAIRLGCDVVASAGGAGRGVLIEASMDDPHAGGRLIAELPGVARSATIIGPSNYALLVRFSALEQLPAWEKAAVEAVPSWRVNSRSTVLRTVKRQGHVLDDEGRVVHLA